MSIGFTVTNELVDSLLRKLTESELKCYLVIMRQTLAAQQPEAKISISQFMDTTGLSNRSVITGCSGLELAKLIVVRKDDKGNKFYGMSESTELPRNIAPNSCSDSMPSIYITILNNQGSQPLEIRIKQGVHRNEY